MHPLRGLSRTSLLNLAGALGSGAVGWPPSAVQLGRLGLEMPPEEVCRELLAATGSATTACYLLKLLADERASRHAVRDRLELVWSGPEGPASRTRETSVVVRELFQRAERTVLVSTYAIAQGDQVFSTLARRMADVPALGVRLFVNVGRPLRDDRPDATLLADEARALRALWPGPRLPEVFYDRRSLSSAAGGRYSLHAKCVVVDSRWSLVTSANFTEAAQQRNIEAGLLVDDESLARSLHGQFSALVAAGTLVPLDVASV